MPRLAPLVCGFNTSVAELRPAGGGGDELDPCDAAARQRGLRRSTMPGKAPHASAAVERVSTSRRPSRTLVMGTGPAVVRLRSAKGVAEGAAADPLFTSVKPTAVTVVPSAAPPTVLMTTAGRCAVPWPPCAGTGPCSQAASAWECCSWHHGALQRP